MYNKKGICRGFFPWEGEPQICLLLLASQKKCEAFLGQLVKEMNKTCTYGTEERSALVFSVFSLKT